MDSREVLEKYALSFLGKPYLWGGDDPMSGFDCSGLVLELLKSQGLAPAADVTAQMLFYHMIKQGPRALTGSVDFGTLLFFGSNTDTITHVGFALNSFLMLEAGGGGKLTTNLEEASKQNAFIRVRPINNRSDLRGTFNPSYQWR